MKGLKGISMPWGNYLHSILGPQLEDKRHILLVWPANLPSSVIIVVDIILDCKRR